MTNNKTKQYIMLITFGVILFVSLMNLNIILNFLGNIIDLVLPVIIGAILAFMLSVPMKKIEKQLVKTFNKLHKHPSEKILTILSFTITILIILLIVIFIGIAVIPKMIESVKQVYEQLKQVWPTWSKTLESYGFKINTNTNWSDTLDIKSLYEKYSGSLGGILSSVIGKTSSIISMLITIFSALVITLHVSLSRKTLIRQIKKLLYANIKTEIADKLVYIGRLSINTYTKFLSGQFIEAIILGLLMFVALGASGIEYAGLIAILTSVCAFVPYIGAFISCGVAVILTLLSSPQEAFVCFIVYEVAQFIENQFIYPKVVGDSVGMSPLFTFLAVLLGGKLLGLVGILFFIPLTAVIYTLLKDNTNKKLQERNIDIH